MNSVTPTPRLVVYPAQGMLTLISQAWNLLRANLKDSLLIVLAPTLLLAAFHLLVSTLSSQPFLTTASGPALASRLALGLLAIGLSIPCFLFWVLSCCALSRLYYSGIVGEKPLGIRDCWRHVGRVGLPLCLLAVLLTLGMAVMLALDFAVLFAGISLSTLMVGALSFTTGKLPAFGPQVMMIFFMLVLGFAVLSLTIGLAVFQGFFFTFPLLAVSTAKDSKLNWLSTLKRAYAMLFRSFSRLIVYALALFGFSGVLTTVLMSPAWLWFALEMARLGVHQQHFVPMHVQAVMNLASSLASLLILPFHISAMTLLWYDCQVRAEGLDLQLWLNDILRRNGRQPEDFGTEAQPQAS